MRRPKVMIDGVTHVAFMFYARDAVTGCGIPLPLKPRHARTPLDCMLCLVGFGNA
jgi:hypothetical protein